VEVPDDLVAMLSELRDWCAAQNIAVSDRRWRKVVKLLQVSALTNGRSKASIWDAWLLQHCIWSEQNCWIRVAAGAVATDFPLPAGAVFTYTPVNAGMQTISVIQMAALGSFSDGFKTTQLPAAMAIGKNHIGTMAGKLKGLITPTTPRG
jgi:hypothetical protein